MNESCEAVRNNHRRQRVHEMVVWPWQIPSANPVLFRAHYTHASPKCSAGKLRSHASDRGITAETY
jgi:hypothetical protein